MEKEAKIFIESLPYTYCYVHLEQGPLNVYVDEEMQNEKCFQNHSEYACVLYEIDHTYLAVLIDNQKVFISKERASLMLYTLYDFETQHYQITDSHSLFNVYDSQTKRVSPLNNENTWNLIAKHLYIYQKLQAQNQQLAVKKLLGDNMKNRRQIEQLIEMKDTLLERYLKLRASRLGRIQIKIWERRS